MSDFTAAYHLKSSNQQDAINLLNLAKLEGFVFEPINGWTTFVTDAHEDKPVPAVTDFNTGLLLHFNRTSDFLGWGFQLFQANKLLGQYAIVSDEEENLHITNTMTDLSLALLVNPTNIETLKALLAPADFESASDYCDYAFAKLVGLANIEYVSHSQVACNLEHYEVVAVH